MTRAWRMDGMVEPTPVESWTLVPADLSPGVGEASWTGEPYPVSAQDVGAGRSARDRLTGSLRRAKQRVGRVAAVLVDVVYPPSCVHCASALGAAHGLCATCWAAMPMIEEPLCDRLGLPFPVDLGPGLLSAAALADPPVFGRARAVARHDGPARALVHRLKFGDRLDLARPMGRWMARAGAGLLGEADALVPVPLHPLRLWRRRANQACVLGQAVSAACGVPMRTDWLARAKATRPQVGLSRSERALNLQGSFLVPDTARAALAGRRVVLVDDVLTTGATANACSRVLLRAGVAAVDVLTFARVTLAS